ncbi:NACHT and WD domain-containing protein [Colletotrichum orchidophilum]|uniref:NACHT and WD domain-containing protein n=1 Tax=Colletotrichum orchidophilum TaxID=1209926 RepID=A0A1G4BEQ2_9PEZI|nr:NACHT and WD domain-containing protein [Colletotrichum orchidophilum]OHE99782.1 NACHT and WD domain-containing protein [Colletotrichum orchidophilum]
MGGLIVKEAYMQGQNDPEYESIVKSIAAIIFLATPHRGTNLAQTLNRILRSSMITDSKQYIADLAKNSLTLQKINEQFRHIAPKLDIVSFYESQPTSVGLNHRVMVLEKDSSVLGYPGEISKALNADHHGVCKYESPRDPNYITVRNVLKSLVSKLISTSKSKKAVATTRRESLDLKSLLAITDIPATDYVFYRDQWVEGTSNWILQNDSYQEWLESDSGSHVLWLSGGAAAGKSVLSSFIVNSLVESGACCQYFFVRFGDQKKRTLSLMLRSIAYQAAQKIPDFLAKVNELVDEGINFEVADPRTIWDRIFKSILFTIDFQEPLYWIIDGLDEADNPRAVIRLLTDISSSSVPIRVLLTSRKTSEIAAAFQKIPESLNLASISVDGHEEDLRRYVDQELSMPGDDGFKREIQRRIVEGAQNNFLWVRLAVGKVNSCHRKADVELALQQLPVGMEGLYDLELSYALDEDTSEVLDLSRSIFDLCGGFIVDDNNGHVAMIHQTARDCIRCLMTIGLRAKINRNQTPDFLDYAASSWSSHLASTSADSEEVSEILKKFLTGNWVLAWIHFLAAKQQLQIVIQVSRHLSKYTEKRRQTYSGTQTEMSTQLGSLELIDNWAIDLIKVLGKFGNTLRRNPESIYKIIPPFCPKNSAIYQLFGKAESKTLAISGVSATNWDDSLARISPGLGYASSICAAGSQIAILSSLDNIESQPTPLTMLFRNNNTSLIVGSDDGRIRSLDLTLPSPTWQLVAELEETELDGHFLNASNYMALNRDGTLIAAAYRGYPFSAWVIEGSEHIGYCWRTRETFARGEVIAAAWHPHSPEVIGLYLEGVVFKWSPYENEVEEISAGASRLALSKDGELFATGDVHGTVKVYITSGLSLLYQLASQDTVLDLSFSPDLHRFYDIRGHYGNAWEPNVLLKYATRTGLNDIDGGSETESLQASTTSTNASLRVDSITVVAASPAGRLYCYGTERGTVVLYDMQLKKLAEIHAARGFLSIEQIVWSSDGRWICFCDSSKKMFIIAVKTLTGMADPAVENKGELPMKNVAKGPIQQLVFNPDSKSLLVQAATSFHVISLEGPPSVTDSLDVYQAERTTMIHPQDPGLLIAFEPNFIRILDWKLGEKRTRAIQSLLLGLGDTTMTANVWKFERVLVTHDKAHIVAQILDLSLNAQERRLVSFEVSALSALSTTASADNLAAQCPPLQPSVVPKEISSQVNQILSFHSHGRLVFLSRTLSICSRPMSFGSRGSQPTASTPAVKGDGNELKSNNSHAIGVGVPPSGNGSSAIKELFPLPGDWSNYGLMDSEKPKLKARSHLRARDFDLVRVPVASRHLDSILLFKPILARLHFSGPRPPTPTTMAAPDITVAQGHLNKVDIDRPEFINMVEDAKASNEADALLTVREALKKYKAAMFWAMLLSVALIMEGFDGNMMSSFYGQAQFQARFGTYNEREGKNLIPTEWQTGLSNTSAVSQLLGLVINAWAQDKFGSRKTLMFFIFVMALALFIPFFSHSLPVLAVGQFAYGIPWGVFQVGDVTYDNLGRIA